MTTMTKAGTMARGAGLLAGMALAGACATEPTGVTTRTEVAAGPAITSAAASGQSAERRALATLRAATAQLHRYEERLAAGFTAQFPSGCFSNATGGMGVHWLNPANVGTLDPARPQLVIYEPQADGTMRLVAFEFIVPGAPTDVAPELFGQRFEYNTTYGVWVLHVWAWRNNPLGMYADWNPRVTCEYYVAPAIP